MEPRSFQLWPDTASSIAGQVDALYAFFVVVSAFFSLLIAFLVIFFAVKYRFRAGYIPAGNADDGHSVGGMVLEIVWSVIPLGLSMIMFAWGASIYFTESRPPNDSMQIFVTGKRWMWKIQHMEGAREINELHVPINRNIKLTMTSEDVLHDFFIPAFRTKADIVPGKYTTEWFRPTKIGAYHIFCAEYCGTKHSGMVGTVYVLSEADYGEWLARGSGEGSVAEQGQSLFNQLGCGNCHPNAINNYNGRAPNLAGIYNNRVSLKDGSVTRADEAYIRESILFPQSKLVAGYDDIMPTFQGLLSEEGMIKVIEYVKSLSPKVAGVSSAAPQPITNTSTDQKTGRAGSAAQPRAVAPAGNR